MYLKRVLKMVFNVIKYTSIRFISISRLWMNDTKMALDSIQMCGKIVLFF